ncbi:MAG: hypothetical protein IJY20_00060 [Clostridia bacterium]|nr:hypothetical protein [Clostridia bacterium]
MKKRMLSLLLALCMLLTSVPLLVLPVVATEAEENNVTVTFRTADGTVVCTREHPAGYMWLKAPTEAEMTAAGLTEDEIGEILGWFYMAPDGKYYDISAFTSIYLEKDIIISPFTKTSTLHRTGKLSWPLYTVPADAAAGDILPLDCWQGGFTMGYANRNDLLNTYTLYDEVQLYSLTGTHLLRYAEQWTEGGLYLLDSQGFVMPNLTDKDKNTVIAWNALVSGTVNISVDIPASHAPAFIVVKNDKIVYPASTDEVTVSADDRTTWAAKTDTSTAWDDKALLEALTVTAGDQIRFILSRRDGGTSTTGFWPTITYTSDLSTPTFSDEILYGGTTSFDKNFPTYDKTNDVVTWNGGWQLVYYPGISDIAGGKAQLLEKGMNLDGANNALSISDNDDKGLGDVSVLAAVTSNSGWGGNDKFAFAIKNNVVAGYRYISDRTGTLSIDFTTLGRIGTMNVKAADVSFAIYVDGVKVWPVSTTEQDADINANGWYSLGELTASQKKIVTDDANATDVAARRGIKVNKGSRVEILCTNSGGSIYAGAGLTMFADLTYEKAADLVTSFNENKPTYDKTNDIVTWNGGWSLVHYNHVDAIAGGEADFLTKGMHINNDRDSLTIPANAGTSSDNPSTILATAGISASSWSYGSYTYSISAAKGHVGGYRYTTEATGFIDIDFTKLGHFCDMASSDTMVYAIYVDGQKVWPTGDAWYGRAGGNGTIDVTAAANATDEAARRNIFVRKGSRVEFLCTSTDTSKTIWGTAGNLMYADITMNTVDPQLSVAGTVGSAFAMNLTVGNRASYKDLTVKINGEKITPANGIYTLAGIAAKDMKKAITYEVTGKVYGVDVTIAKGETTFADYLTALTKNTALATNIRMLAQATLSYGEAAEKYFTNGSLNATEQALIANAPSTNGTMNIVKNADQSANKFEFYGVSLLLNDEIDIKLYVDALTEQASLDGYTIRVTSNKVNGNGWTLQPRGDVNDNWHFKSIINGIPASAYGSDLSITVMEGETAVSDTLVYSVDAYIARMYSTRTDLEKNLLHAIATMGDAAGGAHIHVYGEWMLGEVDGDNNQTEYRICTLCEHRDERLCEEIEIVYQDTYTFASPVLSIEKEIVTSTDLLTGAADSHVLIKSAENEIYATGTGSALVKTADGYVMVTVSAAPINMLFLSGQSNAEGASAAGATPNENNKYDYADYGKYFLRSPDRMAYYTYTYHSLDITAEESTGRTPASYVVKSLKWGDNTRYSSVSSGPSVTTLCDEGSTFASAGVGAALTAEWIKQTGERVWLVNSAHGGHPIQNFLPLGSEGVGDVPVERYNDYEQAVAVFGLAMQTLENEIKAGHFTLSHMAFYWFQGESDSSSNDLYYLEQFDRVYSELQKDVQLDGKSFDFGGLFTLRSCKDNSGNSEAELYMTGPRIAQYEIGADNSTENAYSNVYVVTNATEQWTSTDADVKQYFLDIYGSEENFKSIFGYDIPDTRAMMHPNIHYAIYGQNEMGIDAARNSLLIMNQLGLTNYDLSYAVQDAKTEIRLLNVDGYTDLTEISIDVTKNVGYVIPQITPIYRVAQGVTLVSETDGYVFDQFRVGVDKTYEGNLADQITFSVYLGGVWLQRYDMPIKIVSSILLDSDVTYAQYGGDLAENPERETKIYSEGSWARGWIDYADGSLHLFDYYNTENGWYYSTGDVLWGNPFHGAYSSQGLALSGAAGSGAAVYWTAEIGGTVTPFFDNLDTNLGDVNIAIMVNGYVVWPETASRLNYDEHSGWYHAYNGDAEGETKTTTATINEALADCKIKVNAGDEIAFVFERVSSVCNMTALPGLQYLTGEVTDAITVPTTPYSAPVETVTFTTSGFDPVNNTTPWDFGYLTYATNTFKEFTVIDGNGWLHEEGESMWDSDWHGAFWQSSSYSIAVSGNKGEDAAIRYTVEKDGIIVPQLGTLSGTGTDTYFAIYVRKANGNYVPVFPSTDTGIDGNGWYTIYDGTGEGETATTAAMMNILLDDISIEVEAGDEILFLFAKLGNQNTYIKCYPSIVYTTIKE